LNLHIFNDGSGYYCNITVDWVSQVDIKLIQNSFINIAKSVKYPNEKAPKYDKIDNVYFEFIKSEKIQRVFFHAYSYDYIKILKQIKKTHPNIKIIWVFWSGEFYQLQTLKKNIYFSYSLVYLKKNDRLFLLKNALRKIKRFFINNEKELINSYSKIDYFASFIKEDFFNVAKISKSKFTHLEFSYLSINQFINNDYSIPNLGNSILINHSSDPSLNHFEIIEFLSKKAVTNKIIIPLSYGDTDYKNILKQDLYLFKNLNIYIEENFIHPDKYVKYLNEVGFAIFNNVIQQGLGNLILLVWIGVKIFLRTENSTYIQFTNWGLKIYSVNYDLDSETFVNKMSVEDVKHNRKILLSVISKEKILENYKHILNV
jgi:dTDP-N-acetylfucosamine:lipid II N-acetylfucosaminyltransferase